MKNNKKGFTIVELVIVIAVIAILAAVLIPTFSTVVSSARETAAIEQANTTKTAVLTLTQGIIPENSVFYVLDNNAATGKADYAFKFQNGKLVKVEKDVDAPTFDGNYAVYVSEKYLTETTNAEGKKSKTLDAAVIGQIQTILGISGGTSSQATSTSKITVTYTYSVTEGETTTDKTATVDVYWSSDILDTSIAFMCK